MSYGNNDGSRKKKTFVIIGISSILLVAIIGAIAVNRPQHESEDISPNRKAINSLCSSTDYKKACEESLSKEAANTTDPKELVQAAFKSTIKQLRTAIDKSATWKSAQKDPRTKQAIGQCTELIDYAIDELQSSFAELGNFDFTKVDEAIIKLKVWLSAVLTYQKTCLDGFEATKGDSGVKMKKLLKTAIMLTHDGLAMIDQISRVLSELNIAGISNRRLLEDPSVSTTDGMPFWVDSTTRKLLAAPASKSKADMVVAKDGSGQFKTINEALKKVPKKIDKRFVIHIKEGVYKEFVQINRSMANLMMIGDGADKTRIYGSLGFKDNITTYKTSSFSAVGDNFIAKNMGFENGAGAIKHQAVALRVVSDMAVFYNCTMDGYQDTLYAHSHRQFYRDCNISGTIDFIFGNAAAVFQNCNLKVRKPLKDQQCLVTAQGRTDPRETTGYVFQGCKITGEPEYLAVKNTSKAYLGRPWKQYSKTIFMNSYIPDFIQPEGWMPWNGDFALDTLFYAEYKNVGPGAKLKGRVKWHGIKRLTDKKALDFTPSKFIQGNYWIRAAGVPYSSGMLSAAKVG